MKKIASLILFSVVAFTVSAQKKLYWSQNPKWIEWEETPVAHAVPPEYASQPAIYLLNDVSIDYRVEGRSAQTYYTNHKVIKVLDDMGIERFSTVEIELPLGTKVPTVKARTISPTGKVRNISKDKIQIWLNSAGLYTIVIPMEGVQKNSEIEYLVKEIQTHHTFGKITFQKDIPVLKTRFIMSYRKDMVVDVRGYNGFPQLKPELVNNRYQYKTEINDIPGLMPEKNSFYDLHTMAIDYRVSYWIDENSERIKLNTWNNLARKLYDENYKLSEKERRAVNVFLTELGVHANGNEVDNIRKIEDGIKRKIVLYPYVDYDQRKEVIAQFERRSMSTYAAGYDDQKNVLDTIISKRAATQSGYLKLFAACLTQANIRHEIGWAWDRSEGRYDPNFESWMGLDHNVIYFPNQKKFLSPTSTSLRYPATPSAIAGSRGIFCAIPQKGPVTGGLYKVRSITPLSANISRHDITASISFSKSMDAKADISHEWGGYEAIDIRSSLPYIRPESMKKYVAGIIGVTSNPRDISTYSFSNENVTNYHNNKPVMLYASVNAPSLVNKAANKYLVNVGGIIGTQSNDYEEKERTTAVDLLYPTSSTHKITISIPKGYKIVNPEAARMNADYLNGELETVISFNSDYKLVKDNKNGDRLVITVRESYNQLHFSLGEYQRFRKVYNTAADFSNVWLVMAKK